MSEQISEIKGYQLQGSVGEGGFGAVYKAYQPLIKREVAIKVIRARFANQPEFIRRFEAEAQLVARLEHLHIVPLFDFWRDPTGAYLVMRLLRGGSLKENLAEHGPWDLDSTQRLLSQIASALSLAHRNGVIHRDLKPANILLDDEGNAYLTDFGIAKDVQHSDNEEEEMVGTPAYSAPEQIQSLPPTPKTDIYSLGLIVYEMLTGDQGIKGSNMSELITNQLSSSLPYIEHIRNMPAGINEILQTATAKNPDLRYDDAVIFARDFKRAISEAGAGRVQSTAPHYGDMIVITDETLNFADTSIDSASFSLTVVNPYKGLRAFQEGDAEDFFGREELTQLLLKRLEEDDANAHFLAVVGPSGSGKSSVVKAGVIPALRRGALANSDKFFIAEMVPDQNVLDEIETVLMSIAVAPPADMRERLGASTTALHELLEELLPKDGSQLFLLIDQFEEIFTQTEDNSARTHFMNSLQYAVSHPKSRLWAVITIRADFYDKPLLYPEFGALVRQRTEVVLPLSRDELDAAISRPAQRSGIQIEPELVEAIISDVQEEPGALPLLQYALTELFERRSGQVMTLKSYKESGGVLGSLARRAEELYNEVDEAQQEAIRQLFLRLVTLGEGTEDTRRRVVWSELAFGDSEDDPLHHVLATYTRFRLLTADNDPQTREPTVEVAHEALIRQWQRLRTWLSDNRENIRIQRQMAGLVQEWQKSKQDKSFLATGMRLRQFESLLSNDDLSLTRDEVKYVEASVAQREAAEKEEAERLARERALEQRAQQFLRGLVAVMFIALIVSAGFAVFAFLQRQDAIAARDIAEVESSINHSRELSAEAQLFTRGSDDPFLGIGYAIEANSGANVPADAQVTLAQTVWQPGARRQLLGHNSTVWTATYSQDGLYVVSGSGDSPSDSSMILWDAISGEELGRFEGGHADRVYTIAFSPDGTLVASGSQDSSVIIWNFATRTIVHNLGEGSAEGHDVDVWSVKFTPDGSQLVSGDSTGRLIVWDVESGSIVHDYRHIHSLHVEDTVFSTDGRLVLTGSDDNWVKVWELETGEILHEYLADSYVLGVRFLPGEQEVVSADYSGKVIFWNLSDDTRAREITIENSTPIRGGLVLTADGTTLIVGDDLGNILFFDVPSKADRPFRVFRGHDQSVTRLGFSPDESELVTSSADKSVIIWDLQGRGAEISRINTAQPVRNAVLSPNGQLIAASLEDGTVQLWTTADMQASQTLEANAGQLFHVAFSPDSSLLAAAAEDGSVTVWTLADNTLLYRFTDHLAPLRAVAFSPDGSLLAAGGGQVQVSDSRQVDNSITVWSMADGTVLHRFDAHTAAVRSLSFSPDGTNLLSASDDSSLILWNVTMGSFVRRYTGHSDTVWTASFSPDGSQFISGSSDTSIILWDTATGDIIRQLSGHNTPVRAVAFSPDGRHGLSGSGTVQTSSVGENYNLRYWDLQTGEVLREFPGHSEFVTSLLFDASGTQALSASGDGNLILWRIESLAELMSRIAANYDVVCVPDAINTYCKSDAVAGDEEEAIIVESNSFPEQNVETASYLDGSLCLLPNVDSGASETMIDTSAFARSGPYTIAYSDSGFVGTPHTWILAWAQYEADSHSEIESFLVRDASGNASQQIADIDSLVAEGIDLLIINPVEQSNMSALETKIEELINNGIAVVMVGFRSGNAVYTSYVGQDDYEVGCIMAQELIALADGEGDIIRIHGVNESPSDIGFKAGASAVLSIYPNISIINESGTDFVQRRAVELVEDNTKFSRLAGILGFTGDLALGGEQGLRSTNRPLAPVVSDHDLSLSRFIIDEGIEGVQIRVSTQMGARAVETALQILRGEQVSQFVRIAPELLRPADLAAIDLSAAPLTGFVGDYADLPSNYWPLD
jgi:WD40 repeat protein/serine/threonine protein kinase/ABC-type sugar transport system substrate-binding protein